MKGLIGCADCGDPFHDDDTGGYNPPCSCGCGYCRSCHDANTPPANAPEDPDGIWHAEWFDEDGRTSGRMVDCDGNVVGEWCMRAARPPAPEQGR